uniref:CSON012591 protein n=1 Tax=Culicoides sonorensis TaxID=179676 RepID=A0A336M5T4_CULSO
MAKWGPPKERAFNLDERLFINNPNLEILQVKWHPASPTDSHLLVLLSDNSIRVYDNETLRHVWRVGPAPLSISVIGTSGSLMNSLGDTAVDFDIAPPRVAPQSRNADDFRAQTSLINDTFVTTQQPPKVEWPILILRGDGNIFILCAGVDTERPHLQGPISFLPQVQDNYGLDSCGILVIPTLPATVVIAESSGKLHHAMLIEGEPEGFKNTSIDENDSTLLMDPPEWDLYVVETVELELGLSNRTSSKAYSCPLFLKKDITNDYRYFVYHNTGLHAITIDFVHQLEDFVNAPESSCESMPILSSNSRAEYLVCTKALDGNTHNPVLGFTLSQSPSGLILLLSSGQVVSQNLITDPSLISDWQLTPSNNQKTQNLKSPVKKVIKDSFENHIRNILKSNVSQPILKLDKNVEPKPQEALEILMQATQVLREQHFTKHDKARQDIQKRVKVLQMLKEQQMREIEQLQNEKDQIRDKAEKLAEMYEDICEKQNSLYKRAQDVVRLSTLRLPQSSSMEKEFFNNLEKINKKTKLMMKNLEQAKLRLKTQEEMMQTVKDLPEKRIVMPANKENAIKEILADMTQQIEKQISDVKKLNAIVNVN